MLKPTQTLAAVVAGLFPTSEKAISEKLTQEEFDAFASETQEAQNRLDAQAQGNQAVANDLAQANANLAIAQAALTTAQTELATANTSLATANETITTLTPKAANWDAHKAALNQSNLSDDSTNTNGKGKTTPGLSAKDQAGLDEKQRLAATYPGLMAGLGIEVPAE
ncbi:hypothetical protein GCM10028818_01050 [Spirosoma horti]